MSYNIYIESGQFPPDYLVFTHPMDFTYSRQLPPVREQVPPIIYYGEHVS